MIKEVPPGQFLSLPGGIVDIRSPSEYTQGHIPLAASIPLFTDKERAQIGTLYKQQGQEIAIRLGETLFNPKKDQLIQEACQHAIDNQLKVHCWRGGLRSQKFAEEVSRKGLTVYTLKGGYKSFRLSVIQTLTSIQSPPISIIGGLTGSGKTEFLQALKQSGEQILDLEGIAHHRGSSFGSLGLPPQPSNEQFENEIAVLWDSFQKKRTIWIEDESRMIGTCKIPDPLYLAIKQAPIYILDVPKEKRVQRLLATYGQFDSKALITATTRIKKRLGGLRCQQACTLFEKGETAKAIHLILDYYDKTYTDHLKQRQKKTYLENTSEKAIINHLLELVSFANNY